jgi:Copper amine oxidase, enzyme domain
VDSQDDSGLPSGRPPTAGLLELTWFSGMSSASSTSRAEDWPVMPVDTTSFWLKPVGFFDRNAALDVPALAADQVGDHSGMRRREPAEDAAYGEQDRRIVGWFRSPQ